MLLHCNLFIIIIKMLLLRLLSYGGIFYIFMTKLFAFYSRKLLASILLPHQVDTGAFAICQVLMASAIPSVGNVENLR